MTKNLIIAGILSLSSFSLIAQQFKFENKANYEVQVSIAIIPKNISLPTKQKNNRESDSTFAEIKKIIKESKTKWVNFDLKKKSDKTINLDAPHGIFIKVKNGIQHYCEKKATKKTNISFSPRMSGFGITGGIPMWIAITTA